MAANQQIAEKELVYNIAGCAMEVLNELGHGLREKTYERALCVEFGLLINFKKPKLEWKRVVLTGN